jgi:serine/threonine protein phosphatase PrpC
VSPRASRLVAAAHAHGDDRVEIIPSGSDLVLVVADGAGGTGGASRAADAVILIVREAVACARGRRLDAAALIGMADRRVASSAASGLTTAVIAVVSGTSIAGASVGDSGAWLVGLHDHVDLTAGQVRNPLIGSGAVVPKSFAATLSGTLLLATDGLLKYAACDRIRAAARHSDIELVPERLVALVRLRSGALQDDVGVLVCRS